MAGNLDKALLQMAGFEDEGDLYAKAADKWSGIETKDYLGKTGYKFQIDKDVDDDAANWGFNTQHTHHTHDTQNPHMIHTSHT